MGNICRSPIAEVVLRDQLSQAGLGKRVEVDSAGTGDWHAGQPMDDRAAAELARNGYDGTAHRARQFQPSWLGHRDLVLALDAANLRDLRALAAAKAPPGEGDRIRLFGEVAGLDGQDIPDPYYGTAADFAAVLALLEAGAVNLAGPLRTLLEGET